MGPTLLKTLSLLLLHVAGGVGSQNQLILTNDCPCPGQNLTFECTIVGGGTTVWTGAGVFDCPNHSNEIVLRHINFGSSVMGECNAGAVIGQSLRVDGNCYTSQLSVVYSESFNGRNVTCNHDDGTTISSSISLMITHNMIVSFPSPTNVRLISASPHQLTFSWNPVAPNCAAIHYNILEQNCGRCPSTTQHNRVVCHDMDVGQNLTCSFVVQNFRTCDGVAGNMSIPVNITLQVPSAPTVDVIPHYSYSTREFVGLTVQFNQLESFQISNGFDGSALSYLINFNNSMTGNICGKITVPASSCVEGICTVIFHMSSSTCFPPPNGINVTVAGQNVLGKGADSSPVTVSTEINRFVDVDIIQASNRVVCTFHNQQSSVNKEKTCSILYGTVGNNCKTSNQLSRSFSDSVAIGLPLEDIEQDYCFSIIANNGFLIYTVEGTFKKDPNDTTSHQSTSCGVALGVSLTMLILLNIVTAIIASTIIFILVKSKQKAVLELERAKAREAHGMYEELDYMYVDRPKIINTEDNISYSIKAANSDLSLYEVMSQNQNSENVKQ